VGFFCIRCARRVSRTLQRGRLKLQMKLVPCRRPTLRLAGRHCGAAPGTRVAGSLPLSNLVSHVHDMHIGTQSRIVSKVPTDMVGVLIEHNIVAVPLPVSAIGVVKGGHRKEEGAYGKSITVTTVESPDMSWADDARKVTMLPRMIEVIVRVAPTRIMSDPKIIFRVHMRCRGMIGRVGVAGPEMRPFAARRGAMCRYMSTPNRMSSAAMLCECVNGQHQ
jgi:hypothetical protein